MISIPIRVHLRSFVVSRRETWLQLAGTSHTGQLKQTTECFKRFCIPQQFGKTFRRPTTIESFFAPSCCQIQFNCFMPGPDDNMPTPSPVAPKKFLTNQGENTLRKRLERILPLTQDFDCLVGYFFISGFFRLYPALESVKKVRILIGLKMSRPFTC